MQQNKQINNVLFGFLHLHTKRQIVISEIAGVRINILVRL